MRSFVPRCVLTSIAALLPAVFGSFVAVSTGYAHEHADSMPANARLGTVSFAISCKPELQGDFNHAIALLHSFWHSAAQPALEAIAAADPECAMAYWGLAMSHLQFGLSWPSDADLAAGRSALKRARAATEQTPRERAYIAALSALYDEFKPDDAWMAFQKYADGLGQIAADYPSDVEAKVFQALTLILAQPPDDANLAEMKQAVLLLTPLLKRYPDHPGIAHYLIHASDAPGMAQDGLEAARRYAQIAPAAPHALHMPSHIFTRLGLWQEDIRSNLASEAAAEKSDAGAENRLHAMEFLEYAYLQIGHDDDAQAIMAEAKAISEADVDSRYGSYYPVVETRLRTTYAIETKDWMTAARIEPTPGGADAAGGLTLLAHAMAAGHLKDRALAAESLRATKDRFKKRHKGKPLPRAGTREAGFIDEIHAWKDFADGNVTHAISLLRPVADREAKSGKGELDLPVREMLAEMLLLSGKPKEALQEYELSLKTDPNRFNALLGASEAAEQSGRRDSARDYYQQLIANCAGATGPAVQALEHAKLLVTSAISPAAGATRTIREGSS